MHPTVGRGFAEGEDREGAEPVVVLGDDVWERAFGSDRSLIGSLIELDGVQRRVIGIMPSSSVQTKALNTGPVPGITAPWDPTMVLPSSDVA